MNNDTVNRIDVLRELAPFRGYIPDKYIDKLIEIMSWLPPAEQPMSAVEYLYHRGRMMIEMGFNLFPLTLEKIEPSVACVEEWACAHPERSEEE